MEEGGGGDRGRWSTAFGLTLAALFLSVFDALALVILPLAVLVVALPAERRGRWLLIGGALWLAAFALSGGALGLVSRGWGLFLGALFLLATLARPGWDVTSRALASVGAALSVGALALLLTGRAADLDAMVRTHFETVSGLAIGDLQTRVPDSAWLEELRTAAERIGTLQSELFPALLALQSLAALALCAWWVRRLGRSDSQSFQLRPLREFRFNDQLIWLLIAALLLFLLPLGPLTTRIAGNALFFMGALYALRGLAVFVFLASGSRSVPTMVLGVLALVFLYPVAFTAALLMGVGDTWLDVRRRAATVGPPGRT